MTARDTAAVLREHLQVAAEGKVEADIAANYAEDVVLLTGIGVLRGHDGVRRSREVLGRDLPDGEFEYLTRLTDGEYAFLEWRGRSEAVEVDDGADSFVIRDGLIRFQGIHYTVRHRPGHHEPITSHPGD